MDLFVVEQCNALSFLYLTKKEKYDQFTFPSASLFNLVSVCAFASIGNSRNGPKRPGGPGTGQPFQCTEKA